MLEKHEKELELKSAIEQAELLVQKNKFEQANVLYNKALEIYNEDDNESGKADLLYTMAFNLSNSGDIQQAMQLWDQSVSIFDKLGDYYSKASVLHNIGTVMAQHGNIPNAVNLWNQSLELKEKIDDTIGMAATLINLAWVANIEGDSIQEHKLNLRAAHLLAKNKVWPELIKILINLAKSTEIDSGLFLAQALWLAVHTEIDPDTIFFATSDLLKIVGLENESAPVIASAVLMLINLRSEEHPKKQEIQLASAEMLAACILVKNVPQTEISNWLISKGLNDSKILFPEFKRALNLIVGDENWIFDRENFAESDIIA